MLLGVLPGFYGDLLSIKQLLLKLSDLPFSLASMDVRIEKHSHVPLTIHLMLLLMTAAGLQQLPR